MLIPYYNILCAQMQSESQGRQLANKNFDRPLHSIHRASSIHQRPHQRSNAQTLQLPRFYSKDHNKIMQKHIVFKYEKYTKVGPHLNAFSSQINKNIAIKYPIQIIKTQNATPTKSKPISLKKYSSFRNPKNFEPREQKIQKDNPFKGKRISSEQPQKAIFNIICQKVKNNKIQSQVQGHGNTIKFKQNYPTKPKNNEDPSEKVNSNVSLKVILKPNQKKLLLSKPFFGEEDVLIDDGLKSFLQEEYIPPIRQSKLSIVKQKDHFQLQQCEKESMLRIWQLLRNAAQDTQNLDHAEQYIVMTREKIEKKTYSFLNIEQKHNLRMHFLYCRLTFYLFAHLILLNKNNKFLSSIFSKLAQSQGIICSLFGLSLLINDKNYLHHSLSRNKKPKETIQYDLVIQNKGGSLKKNNELIFKTLYVIFSKKNIPKLDLFKSLLETCIQIQSFEHLHYIDKTLKWEILNMPTQPFLPKHHDAYTHFLILDLDQTLIHFNSENNTFHVRPFAEQFLKKLQYLYEITVFTAATKDYADQILNEIDPTNCIKHRLYRNHMTFHNGQSIKDISLLGRDLKTTIIVDNLESNFRLHAQNGILIKSWYGADNDEILAKLYGLLFRLLDAYPNDIREGLKMYTEFINLEITGAEGFKLNYVL